MAFLWTAPCRATFCQGTGRFDWQGAAIIGYRPADHGRVPRLAALHVGETLHRLNCDGAARCKPIASRHTYRTMKSRASSQLTWRHVFVRRSSPILGVQSWIAKISLELRSRTHRNPLTVRMSLSPLTHLIQHPAKCWMANRGTHGPHDFGIASGHGHLHLRHRGEILSKMRAGADAQRGRQYWQRPPQRQWLMPRWAKSRNADNGAREHRGVG